MSISFNATQTATLLRSQSVVSTFQGDDHANKSLAELVGECVLLNRAYVRFEREWVQHASHGKNLRAVRMYHRMVLAQVKRVLSSQDDLGLFSDVRETIPVKRPVLQSDKDVWLELGYEFNDLPSLYRLEILRRAED